MRTKADFKAEREALGLTQQNVADALQVNIKSVKRWEKPDYQPPQEAAWNWLEDKRALFEQMAEWTTEKALTSGASRAILTYYRTQEQFDELGRDKGPFGFANAVAREVGARLEAEGMEVEYRFPDDGAIRTDGSNY